MFEGWLPPTGISSEHSADIEHLSFIYLYFFTMYLRAMLWMYLLQQQQKARQMEEEIMFGSKPAGTKRFAGNTPTKTPSKLRKVVNWLWPCAVCADKLY